LKRNQNGDEMKKVIIYGAGSYGKQFFYEADRYGKINIEAFTMDMKFITNYKECGLPVVPFEEVDQIYPPEKYDMIVLCGYLVMRNRLLMYKKAKEKGYTLVNYISPHAFLENEITMGENNIILTDTVIGYDGVMGNGNIICPKVYLGHEFIMEDHSIISAGCVLGGNCRIGSLVFIGIGVTARDHIIYGDECLVGMGSNVVKNVKPYSTVWGNPAEISNFHEETGVIIGKAK
jgi:sugar O-acyltransferase (sialic acid O-acetyltransferase NeuD family)